MKNLLAIPFSHFESGNSENGVKYEIVDLDGTVYLRCIVTTRKYSDHDLTIKELAEAPSNVRVEVKKHFDDLFGKEAWKVVTRVPFNSVPFIGERMNRKLHTKAVELQFNTSEGEVKRHQISN